MRIVATTTAIGLLLAACGGGGAEMRRARLEVEGKRLEASLDRLEARLLDGRARERVWQELRARHDQVSAVACEVNERHLADMILVEAEERQRLVRAAMAIARVSPPPPSNWPDARGGGVPVARSRPPPAPAPEPAGAAPSTVAVAAGAGGD